jgi:hypothetical protein
VIHLTYMAALAIVVYGGFLVEVETLAVTLQSLRLQLAINLPRFCKLWTKNDLLAVARSKCPFENCSM